MLHSFLSLLVLSQPKSEIPIPPSSSDDNQWAKFSRFHDSRGRVQTCAKSGWFVNLWNATDPAGIPTWMANLALGWWVGSASEDHLGTVGRVAGSIKWGGPEMYQADQSPQATQASILLVVTKRAVSNHSLKRATGNSRTKGGRGIRAKFIHEVLRTLWSVLASLANK